MSPHQIKVAKIENQTKVMELEYEIKRDRFRKYVHRENLKSQMNKVKQAMKNRIASIVNKKMIEPPPVVEPKEPPSKNLSIEEQMGKLENESVMVSMMKSIQKNS